MKTVFVFLTTGFEDIEAIATIDVLRRAGIDTKTVSLENSKQVVSSHNIPVIADVLFNEANFASAEMLVLPGGTTRFNEHGGMKKVILDFASEGEKVAAICASPMVLGGLGLLEGKPATCYPGFEKYLKGAILKTSESVIVDGNITTGRGPGFTVDFALKLVELIAGKEKSTEVAKQLLIAE